MSHAPVAIGSEDIFDRLFSLVTACISYTTKIIITFINKVWDAVRFALSWNNSGCGFPDGNVLIAVLLMHSLTSDNYRVYHICIDELNAFFEDHSK